MAQKISVETIDDLDGTSIADTTINFAFDGISYEIDLSNENAEKFRNEIAVWIGHSRSAARSSRGRGRRVTTGDDLGAIRSWAQSQGLPVAMRGRVSADIVTAYHKRNSSTASEKKSVADRASQNRVAAVTEQAAAEAVALPAFLSAE